MSDRAVVILENGRIFYGKSFGFKGESAGEVVFNTSHTGYQEILTDPSYKGQIVTMTYPLIGNYGVNTEDVESRQPFASGIICREYSKLYSNWRADKSLGDYLIENKIVGVEGIDTRSLVKTLRDKGAMKGFISAVDFDEKSLKRKLEKSRGILGIDLVKEVTCKKFYEFYQSGDGASFTALQYRNRNTCIATVAPATAKKTQTKSPKVIIIDCGVKLNIPRSLLALGLQPFIVPADTPLKKILSMRPDGILFSNGPGDPEAVPYVIETLRKLLDFTFREGTSPSLTQHIAPRRGGLTRPIPIMGICLGHQILGLAAGGKTYKLKFGHHGANQPIKDLKTGRVMICSENHNFAVRTLCHCETRCRGAWQSHNEIVSVNSNFLRNDKKTWTLEGNKDFLVTHVNLNDGTSEGMEHKSLPIFSVQFHPEASPGPHDSVYLFDKFKRMINLYASKK